MTIQVVKIEYEFCIQYDNEIGRKTIVDLLRENPKDYNGDGMIGKYSSTRRKKLGTYKGVKGRKKR